MKSLFVHDTNMVLATDLYQLTMMAAYLEAGMEEPATFELFVRRLPANREFLVSAGLEQALHYLQNVHFDEESVAFLREHPVFANITPTFFDRLSDWRFSGDVWAIPEGTPFFPNEPIIQIRAPLFEAQLVETYLLALLNYQTSVASKAARVSLAAQGRGCVDFGTRRGHGPQSGVYAARAAYIGQMVGTSNILAGKECNIPVVGTAAHAFTMACPSEMDAFERYHAAFPEHTTLLIDTYDTHRGAERACDIAGELKGVRLDSGDLCQLSKEVREILDGRGRTSAKIVASGDLNEYKIARLIADGAKIDLFGVGTELTTTKDHPSLGGVFKLVSRTEDGVEHATMKLAEGKMTYPAAKQIWRVESDGVYTHDIMTRADADAPDVGQKGQGSAPAIAKPLLVQVMSDGKRTSTSEEVAEIRARCAAELAKLPEPLREIAPHRMSREERKHVYPLIVGEDIKDLIEDLKAELG